MLAKTAMNDETDFSYLGLLARVKAALNSRVDLAVDSADVRPFPGQPREYFNEEAIKRLSESIDASGQTTPGLIRENPNGKTRYELIDGERRWRAVRLIQPDSQPLYRAQLIVADDEVVQYLIAGIANFNREGHTPLETSDTINRLRALKLPLSEIAGLLGVSEMWASQMAGLRTLAPKVRAMLNPDLGKAERLPVTAAIEISKITGPKAAELQEQLATRVIRRDINLVSLRGEVLKTAKIADVEVRTRVTSPKNQFERIRDQSALVLRTVALITETATALQRARYVRPQAEIQILEQRLERAERELTLARAAVRKLSPAFR